MNWRAECAAVIPCLNESASIEGVVEGVRRYLATVVVVDDGSSDATAERAASAGSVVLRHTRPRGKGATLATGLAWVHAQRFPWATLLDGDGQHAPEDIPVFLRYAERTEAALLVGNRMKHADSMPWLRRAANRWLSRRLSARTGRPLPDSQCGFRMLRVDCWSAFQLQTAHFEVESEFLLAFLAAGHHVEFVPVRVIYGSEQTKVCVLKDTLRWFWWFYGRSRWAASQRRVRPKTLCIHENASPD